MLEAVCSDFSEDACAELNVRNIYDGLVCAQAPARYF